MAGIPHYDTELKTTNNTQLEKGILDLLGIFRSEWKIDDVQLMVRVLVYVHL